VVSKGEGVKRWSEEAEITLLYGERSLN